MIIRFTGNNPFPGVYGYCLYKLFRFLWLTFFLPFSLFSQGWTPLQGPFTGKINCIFFSSENIGLVGIERQGIWRTDENHRWRPANNGLDHLTVWSLTQKNAIIFAGTQYGGVYRSEDGGFLWLPSGNGLTSTDIRALAVTANQSVVAGTVLGGICRSTDNGLNWFLSSDGMNATIILCLMTTPDNRIFAGTGGQGVFCSTNDGVSWFATNQNLNNLYIWSLAYRNGELLAGTMGGGVFRSTNYGRSWIPSGLSPSFINALCITPDMTFYAATRGQGLYRSIDYGQSWISLSLPDSVFWSLAVRNDGTIYAGSSRYGIFSSTDDGLNWRAEGGSSPRLSVFTQLEGKYFAGAYKDGLFFSVNQGNNWAPAPLPYRNNDVTDIIVDISGKIYIATSPGGILRNEIWPHRWIAKNNGLPQVAVNVLATSGNILFAGTHGSGIFRSVNQGDDWLPTNSVPSFIKKIYSSPNGDLFAATLGNGIFRSTDFGIHWFSSDSGLNGKYVFDLISDAHGWLFAAVDDSSVWRSTDNGQLWIPSRTGIENRNIRALAFGNGILYAGGKNAGVFFSTNHGISWQSVPGSESLSHIIGISAEPSLTVATEFHGLWRADFSVAVPETTPAASSASNIFAYPNPFNNSITLRFFCRKNETLQMAVYNVLGQRLYQQQFHSSTGWNNWIWKPDPSIAGGLYLIRIHGINTRQTKKILYVK